jgi:hypothetical protein
MADAWMPSLLADRPAQRKCDADRPRGGQNRSSGRVAKIAPFGHVLGYPAGIGLAGRGAALPLGIV